MQTAEDLVVETRNGKVRGAILRSVEDFDYCAFKGVPYAKPPIGDLRFKDPVPAENWTGIRDATKFGNMSAQYYPPTKKFEGSEDCLYCNIYVRSLRNKDVKKPVMVWIHGGAYTYYSADDVHYGPDYLLRKDIVLVTFNYRLGIFGFLNLNHEVAAGNQGVKDQLMLLKWVQANIEQFGGDKNNVTLFGESGGATCAHLLAVSPMSKGLIHKLITQSGLAFFPWSRIDEPKKYAVHLCNILGKYLYNPVEIYEFLKTMDCSRLIHAQEQVRKTHEQLKNIFPFIPSVDDKSPNPIMPIPAEEIAEQGVHVPFLLGNNSEEGLCFFIELKKEVFDALDKNFPKIISPLISALLKKYNLTIKDVKKMYFGNEQISHMNRFKVAKFLDDWNFTEGFHRAIKTQVEKSSCPTYAYKFSYDEKLTLCKALLSFPVNGAMHFDEVEYLFFGKLRITYGLSKLKKGTPSYKIMERMTEMWTNFATYGTPTPKISELLPVEWLPVNDGTNLNLLNIDTELKMIIEENIENKFLAAKSKSARR